MANIQQAAKWMDQGYLVRRPWLQSAISLGVDGIWGPEWVLVFENGKRARDRRVAPFDINDLLADDWEKCGETTLEK